MFSQLNILRLLQFSDSAFPIGTFSFSNGLESASFEKLVKDAETLRQYVHSAAQQAAYTDCIAAKEAFRRIKSGDYEGVKECDEYVILYKNNAEARLMLTRMGKKMAELSSSLTGDPLLVRWLDDINKGNVAGTYPVTQAIAFAIVGLDEQSLFYSHQYGVINMILSAALRCVRVSHLDTQKILYDMEADIDKSYLKVKDMTLNDMNAFVPELEIMASVHETGMMRMFMN